MVTTKKKPVADTKIKKEELKPTHLATADLHLSRSRGGELTVPEHTMPSLHSCEF